MKTILVTGGLGFIGSNFIRMLLGLDRDLRVINLDKQTYAGNPENLADLDSDDRYQAVIGDIGDQGLVARLLDENKPDTVVNFAAESHVDRSIDGPEPFVQTNVLGTLRLLEASRKFLAGLASGKSEAFRFLHVSTDEVYGSLGAEDPAFCEKTPYAPNSPYSASKAGADHLVRSYFHTYGFPVLTTNCSNNYGPCQFPEKLIPLMILNACEGKSLPIYGDGGNIRDWLHVEDHCSAIDLVLHEGEIGEVYNVGGENDATGLEVAKVILQRLGKDESLLQFVADRSGHDQRYALDSSKVQALGWKPSNDFRAAMQRTVDWYVENESWWREIKERQDYKDYYQRNYGNR